MISKNKVVEICPCPFCGSEASSYGSGIVIEAHIVCSGCGAYGRDYYGKTERSAAKKAIKAWNKRVEVTEKNGIKSCPFCGGETNIYEWDSDCYSEATADPYCNVCGARMETFTGKNIGAARKKAVASWNTRTQIDFQTGNKIVPLREKKKLKTKK